MQPVWSSGKTMAVAAIMLFAATSFSHAQTLTVTLSAAGVNFPLTAGSANNPGSTSITATTVCGGCFFRTVNVYAYFNNAASALTNAGFNIPSSAFQISNNGGAFQALTNTEPFGGAGAGVQLSNFFVFFGAFGSTHNDTMNFNIDLSGGTLPTLPPGTYTGTLTIRAQAP
jgi:hypothetical protein